MLYFGKISTTHLDQCDSRLVLLAHEVLNVGMDFSVTSSHRGKVAQNEAFHTGLSKVEWPNSLHNREPAQAIHFVPYPIEWKNLKRFYHLAGIVRAVAHEMELKIRWGGDWDSDFDLDDQTFMDLAHYELVGG